MNKLSKILLIIGGLNWGLVGLFNLDLVDTIFGGIPGVAKIVYILVGVSAVLVLVKGCGCKGGTCAAKRSAPAENAPSEGGMNSHE